VSRGEIVVPPPALAFLVFTLSKKVHPVPDPPFDHFAHLVAASPAR
jgi:hypothetical protein